MSNLHSITIEAHWAESTSALSAHCCCRRWGDGSGFVKIPMLADKTAGFCNMYQYGGVYPAALTSYPNSGSTVKPSPPPPAKPSGCADYYAQCPAWAKQKYCQSE